MGNLFNNYEVKESIDNIDEEIDELAKEYFIRKM